MIAVPRLWKVRTVTSRATAVPRRSSIRSSISLRASRANARSSSSEGLRNPFPTSQPALATMTEVLPLPAAATTRLRRSSTTTALRCSSVSGRASIRSKNSRVRTGSLTTNASLAFALASSGASRNSRIPRSIRTSGASDSASGHRAANRPTTVCASASRSRIASAVRYLGGSANAFSRSCTERSVSRRRASVRRHQSHLASSSASAKAFASVRDKPETCTFPVVWRTRMLE